MTFSYYRIFRTLHNIHNNIFFTADIKYLEKLLHIGYLEKINNVYKLSVRGINYYNYILDKIT